jgi:signal transduction histidine kinase
MTEASQTIRVLLVDDEADFRQVLARRLVRRGLVVAEAEDGRTALDRIAAEGFDVVVLDVRMPEPDGLATLERIRSLFPGVEVILLTGQASAQDGVAGILAGAFDYLTKPVHIDHLYAKIKQAYERSRRESVPEGVAFISSRHAHRMSEAEWLASLGTMASGIAHEINNPLAIIAEAAAWLRSRLDHEGLSPESLRRFDLALGKIEAGVDRASRITRQLLRFSKRDDWTRRPFDTVELMTEVVDLARRMAMPKGVEVAFAPLADALVLVSDPGQVRQVLVHVVTNALQAVGPQGRVTISLERENQAVLFRIQDDGPGIPQDIRDRIFDPFFSTKPPGQGAGLGLSVSRDILERLGGAITVTSRMGEGTTFTIRLPLGEAGTD